MNTLRAAAFTALAATAAPATAQAEVTVRDLLTMGCEVDQTKGGRVSDVPGSPSLGEFVFWVDDLNQGIERVKGDSTHPANIVEYTEAQAAAGKREFLSQLGDSQIAVGGIIVDSNKLLNKIGLQEPVTSFAHTGEFRKELDRLIAAIEQQELKVGIFERRTGSLNTSLVLNESDVVAQRVGAVFTGWAEKYGVQCDDVVRSSVMHNGIAAPPDGWSPPASFSVFQGVEHAASSTSDEHPDVKLGELVMTALREDDPQKKRELEIEIMVLFSQIVADIQTRAVATQERLSKVEGVVKGFDVRRAF